MVKYPVPRKQTLKKPKKPHRKYRRVEHQIQDAIRLALNMNGYICYRANVGLFYTKTGRRVKTGLPNGFPDLFGFCAKSNKIFFIEVKTPTGKISVNQKRFHYEMMHYKQIHGVARSVDDALKIVKNELIGYGYGDEDKTFL